MPSNWSCRFASSERRHWIRLWTTYGTDSAARLSPAVSCWAAIPAGPCRCCRTELGDRLNGMATRGTSPAVELTVGDRDVRISNPERVYFPETGFTKLDLANYYLSVGDGIVRALRERPCMMHRFPDGLAGEKGHQ